MPPRQPFMLGSDIARHQDPSMNDLGRTGKKQAVSYDDFHDGFDDIPSSTGKPVMKGGRVIMPCGYCGQHGHDDSYHQEARRQTSQAVRDNAPRESWQV
jgi:hypothetical protein